MKDAAAVCELVRDALRARLDSVRLACDGMGYGVGEDMDALLAEHGDDD